MKIYSSANWERRDLKMLYSQLRSIILSETAKLAEPVRDFIKNNKPVYVTGSSDEACDRELRGAYKKATKAVDDWMELLVRMDAVESGAASINASLTMPDGDHKYFSNVCRSVPDTVEPLPFEFDSENDVYGFFTPIGQMDYFIYRCIVDIDGNPVMLFYKYLKSQIDGIRKIIVSDPDNYEDDIITSAILEMCGIQDPLGIHRLDACLTHIEEFFDAHGKHYSF